MEEGFSGSGFAECSQAVADRAHSEAEEGDGEDDAGVAHLCEAVDGDHGGFAELGHVGEEVGGSLEGVHRFCEDLELAFACEAFGEDHVCAGFDIGVGAFDGGVEPVDAAGVGACADDERAAGAIACCLGGPLDFFCGDVCWEECFPVEVAATFGEDLVFDVQSCAARQYSMTVLRTISASPKPVSASAMMGKPLASAASRMTRTK